MFLWAASLVAFLPESPHGWKISTCCWEWFILEERKSKLERERRQKLSLKGNKQALITNDVQGTFFLDRVGQTCSVWTHTKPPWCVAETEAGRGVVADDQGVSVCRWERMKRAAKACIWGWWGDLNKIALVFKRLAAGLKRASALQTGFIGTKANYHL